MNEKSIPFTEEVGIRKDYGICPICNTWKFIDPETEVCISCKDELIDKMNS